MPWLRVGAKGVNAGAQDDDERRLCCLLFGKFAAQLGRRAGGNAAVDGQLLV